jgi:hypothetical protein
MLFLPSRPVRTTRQCSTAWALPISYDVRICSSKWQRGGGTGGGKSGLAARDGRYCREMMSP